MAKPVILSSVKRPVVLLAWIHPGTVRMEFMDSVINLTQSERSYDLRVMHAASGPLLSRARNVVLESFMLNPGCTHLLFADSDMHFTPEAVQALVSARKPIVGAVYYSLEPAALLPYCTAMQKDPETGHLRPLEEAPTAGCIEVDAVGMGLTLIERKVIEDLKPDTSQLWPFAETVVDGLARGEDITFCFRAKELGYQTWLCGDARAGHAKTILV